MAEIVVRNLDEHLRGRLLQRAHANGRDVEDEVLAILADALTSNTSGSADPEETARLWESIHDRLLAMSPQADDPMPDGDAADAGCMSASD